MGGTHCRTQPWETVATLQQPCQPLCYSEAYPSLRVGMPRHQPRRAISSHTCSLDLATTKGEAAEASSDHQTTPGSHLGGAKVCRHQHSHVRADELLPRGGPLALWSC